MRRLFLAVTVLAASLSAAAAQEERVPRARAEIGLSFAPVVRRTIPAVVNVYAQHMEKTRINPLMNDPFFRHFFGGDMRGMPRERVERSLGSGVILDRSGMIITNYHVIANATQIRVALADRREFDAALVLSDERADLAVLKLKNIRGDLPTLELADSDSVQVGDLVLAIGDPFGVGQTVTSGIVSALARSQVGSTDFQSFIQTDAAINPGNSGGALVDMSGRLVGINTAIVSRSGGSIGIGFAIPSAMVRVVLDSARAGADHVVRPWLGASLQAVTADIADTLGMERPAGALVSDVVGGGPAAEAGLESGDVIVAIDGVPVSDADEFGYRFVTKPLGGAVKLDAVRGGKQRQVSVSLREAAEIPPRDEIVLDGRTPFAGMRIANLSPALAEIIGMPMALTGVVVLDVEEGSLAARYGFRKKDIILRLNGGAVSDTRALEKMMRLPADIWRITITRDNRQISTILR